MDTRYVSDKSRLVATLLCGILGTFGVHRFYVGKIGTGLLMLVTFGGFGIWYVIDLVLIIVGSFRDCEGRRVYEWLEPEEKKIQSSERVEDLRERMDRVDQRLTDLQGVMIDLSEKFDRRSSGASQ